jgi:hypothetical protein
MVEFDYTPRVAQETAGLGFTLPLPQRQQGVDVRNANPQTRAAQAASMPFYQQSEEIDPTLTNLRDAYIADVQGLNALVQEAVSLGYDPRTIDYQDPQSIEVNKRYREMLEPIKQKEMQLRYAKPVTTRMRQLGQLYDPSIEDISALQGFEGALDVAKAYNQSLTSMGYGQDGLTAANNARLAAQNNITAIYSPYVEKFANNPVLAQSLNTMYQRDISAMEQALPKAPPKETEQKLSEYEKLVMKSAFESDEKTQGYLSAMPITEYGDNLGYQTVVRNKKTGEQIRVEDRYNLGRLLRVPLAKPIQPASTTAFVEGENGLQKNIGDQKYNDMKIVPVDAKGNPTQDKANTKAFKVFLTGAGTNASNEAVNIFGKYDELGTTGDKEFNAVTKASYEYLSSVAKEKTQALKDKKSAGKPAARPATQPAGKTNLKSTVTPR